MNLDEALEKLVSMVGDKAIDVAESRNQYPWASEYFSIGYMDNDWQFKIQTGHSFEECFEKLHKESILFRKFEI